MEKNKLKEKIQILVNHYHAGNLHHVIKETEKLLIKIPNNIFLINLIGSSYQRLGDYKTAMNTFLHILNLDNKNIAAYNNLGNVFKNMKNFEELFKLHSDGKINPEVSDSFDLNDGAQAIAHLKDRKAKGKVIIKI